MNKNNKKFDFIQIYYYINFSYIYRKAVSYIILKLVSNLTLKKVLIVILIKS